MSSPELIDRLRERRITIGLVNEKLRVVDPENSPTPDLLSELQAQKADLQALLGKTRKLTKSDFRFRTLQDDIVSDLEQKYSGIKTIYIATPMQKGLLFHGLLDGTGASYTTQTFTDLDGAIDTDAFRRAWQHVIDRHDILLTCIVGLETDQIHQLVLNRARLPIEEQDIRALDESDRARYLERLVEDDKARGFDFSQAPLMRIHLIRVADDRYFLPLVAAQHTFG